MNVIEYAEKLKKEIENENIILIKNGASCYFDLGGDLTICLPRHNNKGKFVREYHTFFESTTTLHMTKLNKTHKDCDWGLPLILEGPADNDGYRYYIFGKPSDFMVKPYFIQLTKKEAYCLLKQISQAEKCYDEMMGEPESIF
jgi:hypothetical protein